jgi:hypothetical protein
MLITVACKNFDNRWRLRACGELGRSLYNACMSETSFTCCHCTATALYTEDMGTQHRNHCNHCLWSKHVDITPGDRLAGCQGCMEPIGVTLKREGADKYGKEKLGDVMLIHRCTKCGLININRIAADDPEQLIMGIFEKSSSLPQEVKDELAAKDVWLLGEKEKPLLSERLFGKDL